MIGKILSKIGGSGIGKVVDSVGGVLDKLTTSDEERLMINKELEKIRTDFEIQMKEIENEAERIYQQELKTKTELMVAEIKSDDKFVRRVRPMVFLIFTIAFVSLQLMFGLATVFNLNINITPEFIDMLDMFKGVFMSFLTIYVGGRSYEKIIDKKTNKMTTMEMITKLRKLGYTITKND